MEASSSSTAPAEGFDSHLEKQTPADNEFSHFSDDKFYKDDEDELGLFERETCGDGESILPSELDGALGLPPELQQGEPSASKKEGVVLDNEEEKEFEQFDVVQGYSGHYFANYKPSTGGPKEKITNLLSKLHIIKSSEKKHQEPTGPSPGWVRRIEQEWRSLEKDLPEGIYVRVYEERMELLRAAIVGPAGTPYHDGLFFFDVYFPSSYPDVPPLVYYHSHGLGLNPNLFTSGRVCLSLLGTWYGRGCERWSPKRSTLLQVLVSIQGVVFNPKPYFNESFYSSSGGPTSINKRSLCYNESVFLLSCKTMLYTLRQPPKHFEGLVVCHFRRRGRAILLACKAYMEGATVGTQVLSAARGKKRSAEFRSSLKCYFDTLLLELKAEGADCRGLVA